jgi:hypothetical protein
MEASNNTLLDIKEALNEYFKLKLKYESQNMVNQKKIMNNITLSNKEKRSEFLKLKAKCVNCKRPGGSIFKTTYVDDTDKGDIYREHSATCGIIVDPCNLNIKIQIGKVELLPELLNYMEKDIKDLKNEIIDDKNKLLFGYLTTEDALSKFDDLKDTISSYTSLYEQYLEHYNNIVDNEEKKLEMNESITESYINIQQIKDCIKKMNETNNIQFVHDAVNIYITILTPLLSKIRNLKYNETFVSHNDDTNTCNFIQNKYSITNLSFSSFQNKVVNFNVGYQAQNIKTGKDMTNKKKPLLIIESSEESTTDNGLEMEDNRLEMEDNGLEMEDNRLEMEDNRLEMEEPIYGQGKDGIKWNNLKYSILWNKLPNELKTALKTEHDWLIRFMFNCVNSREKNEPCKFTEHPNLIIPPNPLQNGKYDFGVNIYNEIFNKLSQPLKQNYLSMYSLQNGNKNYNMLRHEMNNLVMKEINFKGGIF